MRTVAIYARVSTDDQNCERQVRDLTDYAEKLGYTVASVHCETASGAKDNRPIRKEVMKLAQSRKIDAILVTEMSRWGRSMMDLVTSLQQLESWNVSLIAQIGFTFDLTNAHGKLVANIMASVAEFERELIRERVISGLANAKAKGKKLGRQKGDNFRQDEHRKAVLKLRSEGLPYREIADKVGCDKNTVMRICQNAQQD